MSASAATRRAYREGRTRREDQTSAQPDHVLLAPHAPAPGAPAELLAQLRAGRADRWAPAFERERAAAGGSGERNAVRGPRPGVHVPAFREPVTPAL
ncbi:hypothetical protein [Streptomyces sp. NRRL S-31]|uniref:hypothetical protein n=1 Tax=Streptomyces sp. NRRL S-31 TaxID=1463898 RepID=UPI0020A6C4F2|nr:hypothetical protein [Streptomyces sp. NRRL S-31]